MRGLLFVVMLLLVFCVAFGCAAEEQTFPIPPKPPLGANRWQAVPQEVEVRFTWEPAALRGLGQLQKFQVAGTLPLPDQRGKPMAARMDKEGLALDPAGTGAFALKVLPPEPAATEGRLAFFDLPAGSDARTSRPRTERYALRFTREGETWYGASAGALAGTWQGRPVRFLDVNANGRFDDAGVDEWVVGDGPLTVAYGGRLELPGALWTVALDAQGRGPARFMPVPYTRELDSGLEALNRWRERHGLPPVLLHDALTRWAQAHAEYLAKNGALGHAEDPKRPGYTAEGAWSGAHSNIAVGCATIAAGAGQLEATFFHRILMLSPYWTLTGIGQAAGAETPYAPAQTVLDIGSCPDTGIEWLAPIASPPDGASRVAASWDGREHPEALTGAPPPGGVGPPVTLTFPSRKAARKFSVRCDGPCEDDQPRDVAAELREEGPDAASAPLVECWSSDPRRPAQPAVFPDNLGTVCLIPKAPLKEERVYVATVCCTWNGKPFALKWRFTTGATPVAPLNPHRPLWRRTAPPPLPAR